MTIHEMNISNPLGTDAPTIARSFTKLATGSDASDQLHHQPIKTCDEPVRSKRRKLASSIMEAEEPQYETDDRYRCGDTHERRSTTKSDQILYEEELVGCRTPPHIQCTCKFAVYDCSTREEPITEDFAVPQPQTAASIGDNQGIYIKGEPFIHNGDGIDSMCVCSTRREPPPAPRKPKARPRIRKSDRLNFFVPPDLELFFSTASALAPTDIHKQANHDA